MLRQAFGSNLPFPAREDETGGLGLPVPSEMIKLKYIIVQLMLVIIFI